MKISLVRFNVESYITVENKYEGDHFYIIRKGKVKVFSSFSHDESIQRILGPGDFFAVVSSMTGHSRLNSSQALEDTELISIRKGQFGFLIQQSAPLALKIIRSFSSELRKYDELLVRKTLFSQKAQEENPDQLYFQGEFYEKKGEAAIAAYIYTQYIKNFSYSQLAIKAQERLRSLDRTVLAEVKEHFNTAINRQFKAGQVLFSEFEAGYEMFIIETGRVNISKLINEKEVLIAVLKKGDIFGEMSLLNNENRSATAIAVEDTSCTVLTQKNFNAIIKANVKLAVKIIALLSERLWTIYKQLDNFYFSDIKSRIYDTLVTQVQKKHIAMDHRTEYVFDIGPKEIKNMLGIDEEPVQAAIDTIFKGNIMGLKGDKFYCKNLLELEKEVDYARKMEQRKRKIETKRPR